MSPVLLRESISPAIVRLTFLRPERSNAFSLELLRRFVEVTRSLSDDRSIRALILSAVGKNFSGGLDFHEAADDARLMPSPVVDLFLGFPLRDRRRNSSSTSASFKAKNEAAEMPFAKTLPYRLVSIPFRSMLFIHNYID